MTTSNSSPSLDHPQPRNLDVNHLTREPFLRLKSHSHKGIIITPPRLSDARFLPPILNHPAVHPWLASFPYPCPIEYAETWIKKKTVESSSILQNFTLTNDSSSRNDNTTDFASERKPDLEPKFADGCPFRIIRKQLGPESLPGENSRNMNVRDADSHTVLLGHISITRCPVYSMEFAPFLRRPSNSQVDSQAEGEVKPDWDNAPELVKVNNSLTPGDPEILWTLGYWLDPAYHNQGIISDAISTLLEDWAIPYMNAHKILAVIFFGNEGSIRVLEKNRFVLRASVDNHAEIRDVMRGMSAMYWER